MARGGLRIAGHRMILSPPGCSCGERYDVNAAVSVRTVHRRHLSQIKVDRAADRHAGRTVTVRLGPDYGRAEQLAKAEGISLYALAQRAMREYLGRHAPPPSA